MKFRFAIVLVLLLAVASLFAQTDRDNDRPGVRTPRTDSARWAKQEDVRKKRIREGTLFKEKRCVFRLVGTRPTLFYEDESARFQCLENLSLERVMQVVQENPSVQIWSVDGMFTEFRGENYVLIQRAVLAPSQLSPLNQPSPTANPRTP